MSLRGFGYTLYKSYNTKKEADADIANIPMYGFVKISLADPNNDALIWQKAGNELIKIVEKESIEGSFTLDKIKIDFGTERSEARKYIYISETIKDTSNNNYFITLKDYLDWLGDELSKI